MKVVWQMLQTLLKHLEKMKSKWLFSSLSSNHLSIYRPVDKNLRSVVYCNALRHSTDARRDWDLLWTRYTTTFLATEQSVILTALGCVKDSTILKEYITNFSRFW